MQNRSNKNKRRRSRAIPLAAPLVDPAPIIDEAKATDSALGDMLFEQPLIDEGQTPAAVASERSSAPKGGKARATKLGKAKLSAIAKKAKRSRWKKAR